MIMQILILIVSFLLGDVTSWDHDIHKGGHHKTEMWIVNYEPYHEENTDCYLSISHSKRIGHPWHDPVIDQGCATHN